MNTFETSENINELALALAKAQGEMEAAFEDKKSHYGPYATLNSLRAACKAPLSNNGLSIPQMVVEGENEFHLITMLMHSSGQWIRSKTILPGAKNISKGFSAMQTLGAVVTYMRRYTLAAMLGISSGNDNDGELSEDEKRKHESKRIEIELMTVEECKEIIDLIGDDQEYMKEILGKLEKAGIPSLAMYPRTGYPKLLAAVKKHSDERLAREMQ